MIVDLQQILKAKEEAMKSADEARLVLIDMQDKLMTLDIKKHDLEDLKNQLLSDIIKLSKIVAGIKE